MKNLELLSEIALKFISLDDFETQMNSVLELLGNRLNLSRAYVFIDNKDGDKTSDKYEWCNDGISPHFDILQDIPYEAIPSWKKILFRNGRISSENIRELPEDLIAVLDSRKIISIVVYPLFIDNEMKGFIGFDECKRIRKWSDVELELFRTISGIISNVYERKLFHDRLENSENNFRTFFNTIDDLFIITDTDGKIIYTNRAVEKKLGYNADELRAMEIPELHSPEKREAASEIISAMFRGERNLCPLELVAADGSIIPVETRVWLGKWDGEDCIFRISKDLRKEQEALHKFTKLFESNPALMAISNVEDRRITDVNSSFLNKLGYNKSEVLGKTNSEIGFFTNPEEHERIIEELVRTGHVRDVELSVRCKDGSIINGLFFGEIIDNYGVKSILTLMVDITEQISLRVKVEDQRRRLENIIDGTRLGTWEWNVKTGETVFNERWAEIAGYTLPELAPVSIDTWMALAHPDDLKKSEELLQRHFNGESAYYEAENRMKHKNGSWIWVLDRGKVIEWSTDGEPVRMFGTHSDISTQKQAELDLIDKNEELETFFSVNLDLLCIADTDGNFIKINKAWTDILGYPTEELERRKFLEFIHPDDLDATLDAMSKLAEQEKVLNFVNRYRCSDGTYRYIEWRSHPYGKLIYAAARDITDRIKYQEKIEEISIHDPLTNIYNRRYIFERLEGIISESERNGKAFSISILDIDFFKKINDEHGHLAGDFILKEFAKIISRNLRPYDLFGRYGGEEFIIVSLNARREQAGSTVERILDIIRGETFIFNNTGIRITFSAGISDSLEYENIKISSEMIIQTADNRLYMAKGSGRNRIVLQ